MRIYVGSDHGAVALRKQFVSRLSKAGHDVVAEIGPSDGESVDYPEIAVSVAEKVSSDDGSRGVLLCGTGQGMAITANRVDGIRAGVASDVFTAKMLREHNNAQIVCIGERVVGPGLAGEILDVFMKTDFSIEDRHRRRVDKISSLTAKG